MQSCGAEKYGLYIIINNPKKYKADMAININIEKPDPQGLDRVKAKDRPFSKQNYYMMGGCLALIVIGFILMSGGGRTEENGFNPEIFSTRRIVVGPLLSFLGFLLMAFAIVYSPSKRKAAKVTAKGETLETDEEIDYNNN